MPIQEEEEERRRRRRCSNRRHPKQPRRLPRPRRHHPGLHPACAHRHARCSPRATTSTSRSSCYFQAGCAAPLLASERAPADALATAIRSPPRAATRQVRRRHRRRAIVLSTCFAPAQPTAFRRDHRPRHLSLRPPEGCRRGRRPWGHPAPHLFACAQIAVTAAGATADEVAAVQEEEEEGGGKGEGSTSSATPTKLLWSDAQRSLAGALLCRLATDRTHGARVQALVQRLMPIVFLQTMADDALRTVAIFDASHENPELNGTPRCAPSCVRRLATSRTRRSARSSARRRAVTRCPPTSRSTTPSSPACCASAVFTSRSCSPSPHGSCATSRLPRGSPPSLGTAGRVGRRAGAAGRAVAGAGCAAAGQSRAGAARGRDGLRVQAAGRRRQR